MNLTTNQSYPSTTKTNKCPAAFTAFFEDVFFRSLTFKLQQFELKQINDNDADTHSDCEADFKFNNELNELTKASKN